MNDRKKTLFLALGLVVLLAGAGAGYLLLANTQGAVLSPAGSATSQEDSSGSTSSSEGQDQTIPAIDFDLESADGTAATLLDTLDGRPAVLNFWASTCGPCQSEMPYFQDAYDQYGTDIQFLMVNVGDAMSGETREKAESYLETEQLTFPVYYDLDYSGVVNYGLRGFPATFFLDQEGNVAAYANGALTQEMLQKGLSMAAPDLVEAP